MVSQEGCCRLSLGRLRSEELLVLGVLLFVPPGGVGKGKRQNTPNKIGREHASPSARCPRTSWWRHPPPPLGRAPAQKAKQRGKPCEAMLRAGFHSAAGQSRFRVGELDSGRTSGEASRTAKRLRISRNMGSKRLCAESRSKEGEAKRDDHSTNNSKGENSKTVAQSETRAAAAAPQKKHGPWCGIPQTAPGLPRRAQIRPPGEDIF